jgi:glutaredoxin
MKRILIASLLLTMVIAPLGAAQLYRWVDEKGNVEWRDTPPPPTAKSVEQRRLGTGTPAPASDLPYSLQQAVKNFPVTLWITNCGETCDKARAHLARRGVPHTERNPQNDVEAFKKASGGGMEVPLLLVGSTRVKGYLDTEWDSTLDFAGYPRTALVTIKPKPASAAPEKPASKPAQQPAAGGAAAVRLYTSSQCGPGCDEAKKLLVGRGIAYQELPAETPQQLEELKRLAGVAAVPLLVVGSVFVPGFSAAEYNRLLDDSGYRTNP